MLTSAEANYFFGGATKTGYCALRLHARLIGFAAA
jgi:hypothetical protein